MEASLRVKRHSVAALVLSAAALLGTGACVSAAAQAPAAPAEAAASANTAAPAAAAASANAAAPAGTAAPAEAAPATTPPAAGAPTFPPNVPPAAAAPLATGAPAVDLAAGKTAFEESCSGCHEASLASGLRLSRAGWQEVADRMLGFGLAVTDEQHKAIVDYLAATYPAQ